MTIDIRNIYSTIIGLMLLSIPISVTASGTTLYQSVEQALNTNPQLQALSHNRQALQHDVKQARGGYLPTVELLLGYGLEQHSDTVNRQTGAQPSDSDWDPRSDATLRLTQKVYDGGETGSLVSIRKAQLDSADYQLQAAAQTVALDAITAHLNVFRQRELVSLAEKNLKIHREIHQSLAERERAGAGSIADVTQTQARLARSESTLYLSQADLHQTIANYTRVVGAPPAALAYAGAPETVPQSLKEILQQVEQNNPELLAVETEIVEAESRLALTQANYKPKIDLELSSRYNDQLEGDQSWQNTNAAMLNLRWNLFNGGQDKAGTSAALSRKNQSRSRRTVKLAELTEATATAWANYFSLQRQKAAYRDAVEYSRKTFDAYLKQFSVSRRSLLDVLSAESDYFQSATQLMSVDINETIAAYQLLSLSGKIEPSRCPEDIPEFYRELSHAFPIAGSSLSEPSPEPVKNVTTEQDIEDFIERWALSWREQNVTNYLDCYSEDFQPKGGQPYQEWRETRQQRLTAPAFIDLFVSDMQISKQSATQYQVSFTQEYSSDRYEDKVRKILLLESLSGALTILKEQSQLVSSPSPSLSSAPTITSPSLATIEIGPCINQQELNQAIEVIHHHGINSQQITGSGMVKIFRLLEGVYPPAEASERLAIMKKSVDSAFILPQEGQLALYAGSFHESERAMRFAELLKQQDIHVTPVAAEVEMQGQFVVVEQANQEISELITTQMENLGLKTRLVGK